MVIDVVGDTAADGRATKAERLPPQGRRGGRVEPAVRAAGPGGQAHGRRRAARVRERRRCAVRRHRAPAGDARGGRDQPAETAIAFRIGIDLGDMIVDGGELFGDGVNIAAPPRDRPAARRHLVSSRVHDDMAGRLGAELRGSRRPRSLKNIELPMRAFRGPGRRPTGPEWPGRPVAPHTAACRPDPPAPPPCPTGRRCRPALRQHAATPSRSISPTASPRTSSPSCRASSSCS